MTDPTVRRRTALHEAAHAVADVVLGRAVEYVSIRSGRTFRGISVPMQRERDTAGFNPFHPISQEPPALRADIERQVISHLAGDIAALYLTRPESGYRDDVGADAIARQALDQLGPRLAELVVANEESEDASAGDEANARELAGAFAGPVAGTFYLEWLRAEAHELVIRYRAAILRVADALERHAVLQGEQVAALVYPPKPEKGNTDAPGD